MAKLPAYDLPSSNRHLAETLAEAGIFVFPCDANKIPLTRRGFKDASDDLEEVARLWDMAASKGEADAMPGIDLGQNDLLVMDLDDGDLGEKAWAVVCKPNGGEPPNVSVMTPSGGRHVYFKIPHGRSIGCSRGGLPPKKDCPIDVRSIGGYTIAPGAIRLGGDFPDGVYTIGGDPRDILNAPLAPDWLCNLLERKEPEPAPEPRPAPKEASTASLPAPTRIGGARPVDMTHPRLNAYVTQAVEDELQALRTAVKGDRNNTLNRVAFSVYQFVGANLITDDWAHHQLVRAAEECGLTRESRSAVMKTISSARRAGIAQPRTEIVKEFERDESLADVSALVCRELIRTPEGDLAHADTGEIVEAPPEVEDNDFVEFPAALTYTNGLVGDLTDWICETAMYPNRMMAMGAALALVSTAMGRNWATPTRSSCVLYILALAPSGAGKQHPVDAIKEILNAAGILNDLYGGSEFSGAPAINALLGRRPLCVCVMDEIGAWMSRILSKRAGGYETASTGILRSLWSIGFGIYSPMTKVATGDGANVIHAPHLGIYGTSVQREFWSGLTGADVNNGLMNRFLYLATTIKNKAQTPPKTLRQTPQSILDRLNIIYGDENILSRSTLQTISATIEPRIIAWATEAARLRYEEFRDAMDVYGDEHPEQRDYVTRAPEMAVRIASVLAIGRPGNAAVSIGDIEWGIGVAHWSAMAMAKGASLYIAETKNQENALRVLQVITDYRDKKSKIISTSQIYRRLRNTLAKKDVIEAIGGLIDAGRIKRAGLETASNGKKIEWFSLGDEDST